MFTAPSISNIVAGDYLVATIYSALPPVSFPRKYAWVADLFGGLGDYCISDGTYWKPVRPLSVSDAAISTTTLVSLQHAPTQIMTGNLSLGATATLTFSTTNAYPGAKFRVKRTATGTGILTAAGGLITSIISGNWADVEYDLSLGWIQTASGGLL